MSTIAYGKSSSQKFTQLEVSYIKIRFWKNTSLTDDRLTIPNKIYVDTEVYCKSAQMKKMKCCTVHKFHNDGYSLGSLGDHSITFFHVDAFNPFECKISTVYEHCTENECRELLQGELESLVRGTPRKEQIKPIEVKKQIKRQVTPVQTVKATFSNNKPLARWDGTQFVTI